MRFGMLEIQNYQRNDGSIELSFCEDGCPFERLIVTPTEFKDLPNKLRFAIGFSRMIHEAVNNGK